MGKLFILFAIMPIIEIAILVNVGEMIGGWNTVGIVIVTAFVVVKAKGEREAKGNVGRGGEGVERDTQRDQEGDTHRKRGRDRDGGRD